MDIDLPSLAAGQHRASLEEELGAVFAGLLADSKGAKDVVADIHEVCARRAEALRLEAAEQLHRPARHMALKAVADEMEAQAATWQLLFCLHCDEAAPAGEGGSVVRDAGGALLYRQRLADAVASEPELARCARVVAWLESLAEEAQRRGGGGGAGGGGGGAGGGGGGASFQPLEALWYETKTEMRAGTGSVVSELDPDAPSRTGRPLHPGNARSQERLMGRVWQLLRAGKTPEVLELCAAVGQPWRAAALGGGGPWGALPVGAAAAEADEAVGEDVQAEELADEVSNGAGTLLALWRWAALQAASGGGGGGADGAFRLERAVFGELGDSAAAAAPACGTWEDFAWSYCRSWLESQLSRAVPPEPHSAPDLVAGDVVAAALARCGVPPAAAQRSVEAAMSVVLGTHAAGAAASGGGAAGAAAAAAAATAAAAVAAAQENGAGAPAAAAAVAAANAAAAVAAAAGARAGGGFASMFAQHVMAPSAMAAAGPPAVQSLRQVQGLLVAGDMGDLTSHLYGALVDRAGGGGAAAAGGADGGGDDAGGGAATNPERRWRATALAAHMLLALEGLGVLGGGGGGGGGGAAGGAASMLLDPFEAHKTSDLAQRLLTYYAATLLERGQLGLAPPYLCCLRPGLRGQLAGELLAAHTRRLTGLAAPDADASSSASSSAAAAEAAAAAGRAAADAECYGAYLALEHWFRRCWERQAQPAAALASCLATDIRPNELRLQLATFAVSCRHSPGYGPAARARVARWLAYPYIAALQAATAEEEERRAAAAAADGGGAAAGTESDVAAREAALLAGAAAGLDPLAALDVLDFANCCCCELALGDDVTAAAGQLLFDEVLPPGIDDAALLIAESLESGERSAGAGGEATAADGGAALRLAAALRAQAAELAGWRLYFGLDGQLARWLSRHEAAGPGPEAAALAADGCALLHDYLEQLLAPGWMRELASCSRALEAAAAGGDGAVRVSLTVTSPPGPGASQVPQAQAQGGGGGGGGGWGHPTAPYPELQGAALLEFQLALESGLRRAAASLVASSSSASAAAAAAAVQVAVEGPAAEGSPLPQGHVTVHLAAAPDARSWSALVSLLCGAVRGGLPGVPPLLLVALQADRATSLAVCRRCCVGQAVMRCAALRLSLVALGADAESPATGPQLLEMLAAPPEAAAAATDLVAAAAAGNGPGGLLELLGPGQLAQLLAVEADTAVRHLRNRQVARRLRE